MTWLLGMVTPWPCQVYDFFEYSTLSGFAAALLMYWSRTGVVIGEPPLNQAAPSAQRNAPHAGLKLAELDTHMLLNQGLR